MKELANNEVTMTLKEITDLLNVRHNDAMKIVEKMAETTDFGELRILRTSYLNNFGGEIALKTYVLNERQSIAVGARLNTSMLLKLIDRWQELEEKLKQKESKEITEYNSELSKTILQLESKNEALQIMVNYVMQEQKLKVLAAELELNNKQYLIEHKPRERKPLAQEKHNAGRQAFLDRFDPNKNGYYERQAAWEAKQKKNA